VDKDGISMGGLTGLDLDCDGGYNFQKECILKYMNKVETGDLRFTK
jgi:hypothetical protein